MSISQHITYNYGGTIYIDVLSRPTSATVTIKYGTNSLVSAGACTISSINTTLSSAATKGATSISVASATGCSIGKKCWLQDHPEEVLIKGVSETTVSLSRPLFYDHASSAAVEGTRVSYAVSAAQASVKFWDGRAEWLIDSILTDISAVECTVYPLRRLATIQDLFDENPKLRNLLPDEYTIERCLDNAHDDILTTIAARGRARVLCSSGRELAKAVVLRFFANYFRRDASDGSDVMYDRYKQAAEAELGKIIASLPRDTNQDGIVEKGERLSMKSIRLSRA